MLSPELITYLKQCLEKQISLETVTTQMRQIGWSDQNIEEAKTWYYTQHSPSPIPRIPIPQSTSSNFSSQATTTVQNQLVEENSPTHELRQGEKSVKRLAILGITGVLIFLLFIPIVVVPVFVTYGKISLPNKKLETTISHLVMSIPFTPKTPKYVLEKSVLAHTDMTQATVDFSFATESNNPLDITGLQSFDLAIRGPFDYSDIENPKLELNISTTGFNSNIKIQDQMLYLNISEIPTSLYSLAGINEKALESLIDQWIYYDFSPLQTEARDKIKELSKEQQKEKLVKREKLNQTIIDIVFPEITMKKEKLSDYKTYKLHLDITPEIISDIQNAYLESIDKKSQTDIEASDFFEAFTIDIWIDQKEYYVRKTIVAITTDTPSYTNDVLGQTPNLSPYLYMIPTVSNLSYNIVMVTQLSDFEKPLEIKAPKNAISVEEAYKIILESILDPSEYSIFSL